MTRRKKQTRREEERGQMEKIQAEQVLGSFDLRKLGYTLFEVKKL